MSSERTDSQCAKIKAWLQEGRELTSWDAIRMWGCTRLASRVHDLRNRGINIEVRMRPLADGTRIAVYTLAKDNKS